MTELREGDPVWVNVRDVPDVITGETITYEGTGAVWVASGQRAVVQIGTDEYGPTCLMLPHTDYVVRPYRRPACRYCASTRMVVDGAPGADRLRWTCADCMGGQDT